MTEEEIYEDYESSPHAGNGNSESDRLINLERHQERIRQGYYGSGYEADRRRYFEEKQREAGHAGN